MAKKEAAEKSTQGDVEAIQSTDKTARKVVPVSHVSDPLTTVSGINANKKPKFGKKEFGV